MRHEKCRRLSPPFALCSRHAPAFFGTTMAGLRAFLAMRGMLMLGAFIAASLAHIST
jgi:hypothetical protein